MCRLSHHGGETRPTSSDAMVLSILALVHGVAVMSFAGIFVSLLDLPCWFRLFSYRSECL